MSEPRYKLPDFHPETGHLHTCNERGPCGCAAALYCVAQDAEHTERQAMIDAGFSTARCRVPEHDALRHGMPCCGHRIEQHADHPGNWGSQPPPLCSCCRASARLGAALLLTLGARSARGSEEYRHPAGDTLPVEAADPEFTRAVEVTVREGGVLSPEAQRRVREMLDADKRTPKRDSGPLSASGS